MKSILYDQFRGHYTTAAGSLALRRGAQPMQLRIVGESILHSLTSDPRRCVDTHRRTHESGIEPEKSRRIHLLQCVPANPALLSHWI
uniref:Uncharacterized protein n=1 Tax=Arundo donax TaxID=35708 RepID=A0A0A9H905_ARUDO